MTVSLTGEYTDARIMGLWPDELEPNVIEQIQSFIDHPAFRGTVRVMPDTHLGKGCTIGFTMTVADRIVPNAIGVDIGCGVVATPLQDDVTEELSMETIDELVRETVPMGFHVHDRLEGYHMGEDFPWHLCERTLHAFEDLHGPIAATVDWFDGYGLDYLNDLCERVDYDIGRAINSVGTLGGGNHFIEFAESESTGDLWVTIHSGSRGIGAEIAQYWQAEATENRTREFIVDAVPEEYVEYLVPDLDDPELVSWFEGGMGSSYIDSEAIREAVDDTSYRIGEIHDEIRQGHPQNRESHPALDWLVGEEAHGYYLDMIFAQQYASVSRYRMLYQLTEALGTSYHQNIESVHNFIDFTDGVLRKGATSARDGQDLVIPLNMRDGVLVCEGVGATDWNQSAPHGAGRVMSRTQAKRELNQADVEQEMADAGVYTSIVPLDEARASYKPTELIEDTIGETAQVVDHLIPVLNIKAA